MEEEILLRVKGSSEAPALASVIAHGVYDSKKMTLRTIGAAATNQAMKAVAIAQGYVGQKGRRLMVIPGFADVAMDDGVVTALVFRLVVE